MEPPFKSPARPEPRKGVVDAFTFSLPRKTAYEFVDYLKEIDRCMTPRLGARGDNQVRGWPDPTTLIEANSKSLEVHAEVVEDAATRPGIRGFLDALKPGATNAPVEVTVESFGQSSDIQLLFRTVAEAVERYPDMTDPVEISWTEASGETFAAKISHNTFKPGDAVSDPFEDPDTNPAVQVQVSRTTEDALEERAPGL